MKGALALAILLGIPAATEAQIPTAPLPFTVTKATPLRSDPRVNSDAIALLAAGKAVTLDAQAPNGLFYHVTVEGKEGWADGRYLEPLLPRPEKGTLRAKATITADFAPSAMMLLESHMPPCGSPSHYRWVAKISGNQQPKPTPVTVATVLNSWARPEMPVGHSVAAWCVPRTSDEQETFALTGEVTRIRMAEDDGDWHVELVVPKGAVPNCVVAEIPNPQFGAKYKSARDALLTKVQAAGASIKKTGDLSKRVTVTVIGDAFYDGFHIDATGKPSQHGRCNSSPSALWEIHPVFAVR